MEDALALKHTYSLEPSKTLSSSPGHWHENNYNKLRSLDEKTNCYRNTLSYAWEVTEDVMYEQEFAKRTSVEDVCEQVVGGGGGDRTL